ncbi:MAG: lipid-A-disaccharide synthase, partial [Gammaproteobacteria bacterium]|nr:lipid-A-disaccharide synthase [Gammaproteobacteria bacterium]
MALRIGVVAGEASGDQLGAGLIRAIKQRVPDAVFEGIAGPRMVEAGCRAWYPAERLAVMGLVEVLAHLPGLLGVRRDLARRFSAQPPQVFIGIDAPDFNLALERKLKARGVPTVHYVSPSVWAWRRHRVRKIARAADLMLTLFPFEADFYRRHGVAVEFVGHPLADALVPVADRGPPRAR